MKRSRAHAGSVGVLVGGTVAAQAITAGASPILTRIYGPGELGQLGLFTAFLLIASVAASLRYDTAIPTPADDRDAARLCVGAMALVIPTAVVASLMYSVLVATNVAGFGLLPGWSVGVMLVALTAFGLVTALRYWQIRRSAFRLIAELAVTQSAGRAVAQVSLGLAGLGAAGLVMGEAVGRSLGTLRLAQASLREIRVAARPLRRPVLLAVMQRYRRFPIYGLPSALINALALYLPVPVVVHLYGVETGGALLLVQRVVSVPLAVIGSSVADVFHARLAAGVRAEGAPVRRLAARSALLMFAIGLPLAVVLIVVARPAFTVVFGSEWAEAGSMAVAIAPWALAQFVTYPLSRAVLVYEAQRAKLAFDIASVASVLGALFVSAGPLGLDAVGAIGLLALAQTLLYAGLLASLWHLISSRSVTMSDPEP